MSTAVTGESAASPLEESRSRSWDDIAFHLAGRIAGLPDYDRGGFAGLRRMDPDEPDTAAFWKLMAEEDLLGNPEIERKWGLILHGMALMTRTAGDDVSSRSCHDGRVPVGRALHENGYSETRFKPSPHGAGRHASRVAFPHVPNDGRRAGVVRLARDGGVHTERRFQRGTRRGRPSPSGPRLLPSRAAQLPTVGRTRRLNQ